MRALALAVGLALCGAFVSACAPTTSAGGPEAPPPVAVAPEPPAVTSPTIAPTSLASVPNLSCSGRATQGGFIVCQTGAHASVLVDGKPMTFADATGLAVIGFDRDAAPTARIEAVTKDFSASIDIPVAKREFRVQAVNGLPQDTVTPTDPATLARIARERDIKNVGFGSRANEAHFGEAFVWPVDGVISSPWGNQRVLNGVPNAPHYGVDIAAPTGTPIRAPAGGKVSLAEPDLHYEGGLVMIDHGQGLISLYLHMSRVDVKAGDVVRQGDLIGAVGAKGRATGPHLCWRLKWRDRNLDPSLLPVNALKPVAASVPAPG
jgi:murein DD-endopeptidase MepM/ murein hydrolase activator NlpD